MRLSQEFPGHAGTPTTQICTRPESGRLARVRDEPLERGRACESIVVQSIFSMIASTVSNAFIPGRLK